MPLSHGLPLPAFPALARWPDWRVCAFRPGDQPPRGAEDRHVQADLGDDRLGGDGPATCDLIQPGHRQQRGGVRAAAGIGPGGAVGVDALRGGDLRDQLAGPLLQRRSVAARRGELAHREDERGIHALESVRISEHDFFFVVILV
jgi:hypothetical protein